MSGSLSVSFCQRDSSPPGVKSFGRSWAYFARAENWRIGASIVTSTPSEIGMDGKRRSFYWSMICGPACLPQGEFRGGRRIALDTSGAEVMSGGAGRARVSKGAAGAAPYVPEGATLPELCDAAQKCRGCELYRNATQAVLGEGPATARVVMIGEQPGDQEDLAGKPF